MTKTLAIITAGGIGRRFSDETLKQLAPYDQNLSVLDKTLEAFEEVKEIDLIIITCPPNQNFQEQIRSSLMDKIMFVEGGSSRAESIYNALLAVKSSEFKNVITHDATRPFINAMDLKNIWQIFDNDHEIDCLFYGIKMTNSLVKNQSSDIFSRSDYQHVDREKYLQIQTPQICNFSKLKYALSQCLHEDKYFPSDESEAMAKSGYSIRALEGSTQNIKITYPEDLPDRIDLVGSGFDVHRYSEGKFIMLGGAKIPFDYGIEAISDGDVILHSIADAIFGALAVGDLGTHFPENDPESIDLDSTKIIEYCMKLVHDKNLIIKNIDISVICEEPKIVDVRENIVNSIASIFQIEVNRIGLKGTTMEKIGPIGKGEGIAALSTILLSKK